MHRDPEERDCFEGRKSQLLFAVCEKKTRVHCPVKSSASLTAAGNIETEEKEGV